MLTVRIVGEQAAPASSTPQLVFKANCGCGIVAETEHDPNVVIREGYAHAAKTGHTVEFRGELRSHHGT